MTMDFDRSYWPKSGTIINREIPHDLNDLWETCEDQASVFVAEALLSTNETFMIADCVGELIQIEVFLWTVGGDTITVKTPVADLLDEFYHRDREYPEIKDSESEANAMKVLADLARIKTGIDRHIDFLNNTLADYRGSP